MNFARILVKYRRPIISVVASIASMVIADQICSLAVDTILKEEEATEPEEEATEPEEEATEPEEEATEPEEVTE